MRKVIYLGLLAMLLINATDAYSEVRLPTPTPLPKYLQILELKAAVAERNLSTESSPENLSLFVSTHEKIISAACFGSLRTTLEYKGYPEDEHCRSIIKKVLAVDATSSIANCAQFGIGSQECREASKYSKAGIYYLESGSWSSFDQKKGGTIRPQNLNAAINEKSHMKKLAELSQQLASKASEIKAAPKNRELRDQYESVLRTALKLSCVDTELSLESVASAKAEEIETGAADEDPAMRLFDIQNTPSAASPASSHDTADPTSAEDPFAEVLNSLDKNRPTPTPSPVPVVFEGPQYFHYRLIPNDCARYIQRAEEIIPGSPVTTCYRDGPVAPSCIESRRRVPAHPSPADKKTSPTDAFSSF